MKSKHPMIVIVLISLLSMMATVSNGQNAFTLQQAVDYAKNNNSEVQNARLEVQVSEQEVKSIISTGLPQVNAVGQFTHNVQIAAQQFPDFISPAVYGVLIQEELLSADRFRAGEPQTVAFGAPSMMLGMVTLNQLLFDGTYFLGLNAAKEYVNLSQLLAQNVEVNVAESVSKSYYLAVLSDHNLELLGESLVTLKKTQEETEALYEAGMAEQLDVDRIAYAVANLENQVANIKLQKEMSLKMLKFVMGMNITENLTLTDDIETLMISLETLTTEDDPYKNRIEYQILEEQLVLDSLNIKRYKVGYIPKLTLQASHQQNSFATEAEFKGLGETWNPGTSYSLNLSVPIFDGFYKKAKTDQAKIEMLQDKNTMENFINGAKLELEQARLNYQMQMNNLNTQKQNRILAKNIFDKTRIKFNEGVGSSFELIQAENDLHRAEIEYTNALYNLLLAQLDLQKAIGQLK